LVRALPARYGNQGLNLPGFALAPIRGTGLGFYSYLYRYMYGGQGSAVHLARMEVLREELPGILQVAGQPISDEMNAFIQYEASRNVSTHHSYAHYYSEDLRNLVAQRDAEVIDRHGYRFEA
jgi:hypothetical protein